MNNEYQEQAIQHKEGPCIVIAPPGSGKTYIIMNRIRHLVEEESILESTIYVVTFTRMAAQEMKERYEKFTEGRQSEVVFGTFHSVFLSIMMKETPYTRDSLLSTREQNRMVESALRNVGYEYEVHRELVSAIGTEVSRWKNLGYGTPLMREMPDYQCDGIQEEVFIKVYHLLQEERRNQKKLDFDDILLECYILFISNPQVLAKYQKNIQYLLVDEFQDSNPLQYAMVQQLAQPDQNLFVVGDDDQSIYGFRGANPSVMQQFLVDYPQGNKIILNRNYRSSKEIIAESKCLIERNENRFAKEYEANKPSGDLVTYILASTVEDQVSHMMKTIALCLEEEGSIAIITRTTAQLEEYARQLKKCKVLHSVKKVKKSLYEHQVAKDLCAFLRYTHVKKTAKDFRYLLNKPMRDLSQKAIEEYGFCEEQFVHYYQENGRMHGVAKKFLEQLCAAKGLDPYASIMYFRKAMEYEHHVNAMDDKEGNDNGSKVLEQLHQEAKVYETVEQLLEVWTKEPKEEVSVEVNRRERVQLMTMHGAKGLEFETVLLPDLIEGIVPHRKAKSQEAIEEERRLLYVAMTRAKDRLYCYSIQEKGDGTSVASSPFFKELYNSGRSSSSSIYSSNSELDKYCSNKSEIASNSSSLSIYSKSGSSKISSFSK